MLKTRLIPTLLYKGSCLVKGKNFKSDRVVGSLQQAISVYNRREVDELILLDVDATERKTSISTSVVYEAASLCNVPFSVGGGIRNKCSAKDVLRNGADKVVINSALVENPAGVAEIVAEFGSQCVVASIDVKRASKLNQAFECYIQSGNRLIDLSLEKMLSRIELLKCGELLINSIDRDGCMVGYDLDLIKYCTERVNLPVIASGGAEHYGDFVDAIQKANAAAVSAAAIFHFTQATPKEAKRYMGDHGISVRK